MFRIGVDFDNTIACYDHVFHDVALAMGLVAHGEGSSKADIKTQILNRPNGDLDWQRLQGQIYGKYMLQAEIFPGFYEFLYLSKLRGHKVFIVSHKSEFGHFDEDRIPLRDQALLWLQVNKFFEKDGLALDRQDVFFESTREDKINRIRDLGCTHFIDDLSEVFEEPLFPGEVKKILFRPNQSEPQDTSAIIPTSSSWREVTHQLHGSWSETEVCRMIRARFPSLGEIRQVELKKGRGNSRIYKLIGPEKNYALKIYPDRQRDPRPRLETEFAACQMLQNRGYPVTEAVANDKNLGWGIYRWIEGSSIEEPNELFMDKAIEFVRCLYSDSQLMNSSNQFSQASESCLSGLEITRQIEGRLHSLMAVESSELREFLENELLPYFTFAVQSAKRDCGTLFGMELPRTLQILNPSDFGYHNALRDENGRIVFIDFEYFGWDEPIKLVSDFYWHPGMDIASNLRGQWIKSVLEVFQKDPSFSQRLNSYLPLFGIRWCLILLNEFLRQGAAHRLHADPQKARDLAKIRFEQLNKSRILLGKIKEMNREYGSAIQVS